MELRHVRYFVAVAEEKNFTRAAARLGIGQPPLSQQIRDLEHEIGMPLFQRLPQGAALTPAGVAFLDQAHIMLQAAHRAKVVARQASRGETGRIMVGLTASSAFNSDVSAAILAFRRKWPEVRLTLVESNTRQLLEQLAKGEVDAAFIRPDSREQPNIRLKRLSDEPLMVALPAKHALSTLSAVPIASLSSEQFVMVPRAAGLSLFDDIALACREAGFELTVVQEAAQLSSVINLVASGLGVSIVPMSVTQIKLKGVIYKEIEGAQLSARLAFGAARSNRSPIVANFFSIVGGQRLD